MFTWIATTWATRAGKPLMIVGGALLLLLIAYGVGRCTADEADTTPQVEQGNRSTAAVADAAADALETLEGRTASENAIDQAVTEAVEDIEGAANASQVRNVVLEQLCGTAEHRNDPACTTRAESRS